jgi:asparagine synthase (glutamine-hydrolysing)
MCGINGVLSFTNSAFRVSEHYLTRMRDVMSHRGPDGAGNFISPDRRVEAATAGKRIIPTRK